ncbi:hypothetical protein [Methylobacterium nodulans]|uniref:Phospholipase A2 domain-containing protein n=1 Tax=Methylobacterium nodulans (strain LMG 21967 / CNCM I-2342 / ORS 2060) TaxID=460265 RepID=B8IEL2_METNO|nr:hypothetical protein [Methylobacterium nodulans]ACL59584.1 conserved hypothetical protein [Methylobacterium nodulans ORS 2060]
MEGSTFVRPIVILSIGLLGLAAPGWAQGVVIETPPVPQVEVPRLAPGANPLADGSLVFHGNYCGPGSRGPGLPPTDALDVACMHHDACAPAGGIPSCACNARLQREAAVVARSRRQSPDLRDLAALVSQTAAAMPCEP